MQLSYFDSPARMRSSGDRDPSSSLRFDSLDRLESGERAIERGDSTFSRTFSESCQISLREVKAKELVQLESAKQKFVVDDSNRGKSQERPSGLRDPFAWLTVIGLEHEHQLRHDDVAEDQL